MDILQLWAPDLSGLSTSGVFGDQDLYIILFFSIYLMFNDSDSFF